MIWFSQNILYFLITLLPIFVVIMIIILSIKLRKLESLKILYKSLIIFSILNLVIYFIILNLIVSAEIEHTMLKYCENHIGKPVSSLKPNHWDIKNQKPIHVSPWYSIKPYIFDEELHIMVKNDTIKACILTD
jgi:hypothetical protein